MSRTFKGMLAEYLQPHMRCGNWKACLEALHGCSLTGQSFTVLPYKELIPFLTAEGQWQQLYGYQLSLLPALSGSDAVGAAGTYLALTAADTTRNECDLFTRLHAIGQANPTRHYVGRDTGKNRKTEHDVQPLATHTPSPPDPEATTSLVELLLQSTLSSPVASLDRSRSVMDLLQYADKGHLQLSQECVRGAHATICKWLLALPREEAGAGSDTSRETRQALELAQDTLTSQLDGPDKEWAPLTGASTATTVDSPMPPEDATAIRDAIAALAALSARWAEAVTSTRSRVATQHWSDAYDRVLRRLNRKMINVVLEGEPATATYAIIGILREEHPQVRGSLSAHPEVAEVCCRLLCRLLDAHTWNLCPPNPTKTAFQEPHEVHLALARISARVLQLACLEKMGGKRRGALPLLDGSSITRVHRPSSLAALHMCERAALYAAAVTVMEVLSGASVQPLPHGGHIQWLECFQKMHNSLLLIARYESTASSGVTISQSTAKILSFTGAALARILDCLVTTDDTIAPSSLSCATATSVLWGGSASCLTRECAHDHVQRRIVCEVMSHTSHPLAFLPERSTFASTDANAGKSRPQRRAPPTRGPRKSQHSSQVGTARRIAACIVYLMPILTPSSRRGDVGAVAGVEGPSQPRTTWLRRLLDEGIVAQAVGQKLLALSVSIEARSTAEAERFTADAFEVFTANLQPSVLVEVAIPLLQSIYDGRLSGPEAAQTVYDAAGIVLVARLQSDEVTVLSPGEKACVVRKHLAHSAAAGSPASPWCVALRLLAEDRDSLVAQHRAAKALVRLRQSHTTPAYLSTFHGDSPSSLEQLIGVLIRSPLPLVAKDRHIRRLLHAVRMPPAVLPPGAPRVVGSATTPRENSLTLAEETELRSDLQCLRKANNTKAMIARFYRLEQEGKHLQTHQVEWFRSAVKRGPMVFASHVVNYLAGRPSTAIALAAVDAAHSGFFRSVALRRPDSVGGEGGGPLPREVLLWQAQEAMEHALQLLPVRPPVADFTIEAFHQVVHKYGKLLNRHETPQRRRSQLLRFVGRSPLYHTAVAQQAMDSLERVVDFCTDADDTEMALDAYGTFRAEWRDVLPVPPLTTVKLMTLEMQRLRNAVAQGDGTTAAAKATSGRQAMHLDASEQSDEPLVETPQQLLQLLQDGLLACTSTAGDRTDELVHFIQEALMTLFCLREVPAGVAGTPFPSFACRATDLLPCVLAAAPQIFQLCLDAISAPSSPGPVPPFVGRLYVGVLVALRVYAPDELQWDSLDKVIAGLDDVCPHCSLVRVFLQRQPPTPSGRESMEAGVSPLAHLTTERYRRTQGALQEALRVAAPTSLMDGLMCISVHTLCALKPTRGSASEGLLHYAAAVEEGVAQLQTWLPGAAYISGSATMRSPDDGLDVVLMNFTTIGASLRSFLISHKYVMALREVYPQGLRRSAAPEVVHSLTYRTYERFTHLLNAVTEWWSRTCSDEHGNDQTADLISAFFQSPRRRAEYLRLLLNLTHFSLLPLGSRGAVTAAVQARLQLLVEQYERLARLAALHSAVSVPAMEVASLHLLNLSLKTSGNSTRDLRCLAVVTKDRVTVGDDAAGELQRWARALIPLSVVAFPSAPLAEVTAALQTLLGGGTHAMGTLPADCGGRDGGDALLCRNSGGCDAHRFLNVGDDDPTAEVSEIAKAIEVGVLLWAAIMSTRPFDSLRSRLAPNGLTLETLSNACAKLMQVSSDGGKCSLASGVVLDEEMLAPAYGGMMFTKLAVTASRHDATAVEDALGALMDVAGMQASAPWQIAWMLVLWTPIPELTSPSELTILCQRRVRTAFLTCGPWPPGLAASLIHTDETDRLDVDSISLWTRDATHVEGDAQFPSLPAPFAWIRPEALARAPLSPLAAYYIHFTAQGYAILAGLLRAYPVGAASETEVNRAHCTPCEQQCIAHSWCLKANAARGLVSPARSALSDALSRCTILRSPPPLKLSHATMTHSADVYRVLQDAHPLASLFEDSASTGREGATATLQMRSSALRYPHSTFLLAPAWKLLSASFPHAQLTEELEAHLREWLACPRLASPSGSSAGSAKTPADPSNRRQSTEMPVLFSTPNAFTAAAYVGVMLLRIHCSTEPVGGNQHLWRVACAPSAEAIVDALLQYHPVSSIPTRASGIVLLWNTLLIRLTELFDYDTKVRRLTHEAARGAFAASSIKCCAVFSDLIPSDSLDAADIKALRQEVLATAIVWAAEKTGATLPSVDTSNSSDRSAGAAPKGVVEATVVRAIEEIVPAEYGALLGSIRQAPSFVREVLQLSAAVDWRLSVWPPTLWETQWCQSQLKRTPSENGTPQIGVRHPHTVAGLMDSLADHPLQLVGAVGSYIDTGVWGSSSAPSCSWVRGVGCAAVLDQLIRGLHRYMGRHPTCTEGPAAIQMVLTHFLPSSSEADPLLSHTTEDATTATVVWAGYVPVEWFLVLPHILRGAGASSSHTVSPLHVQQVSQLLSRTMEAERWLDDQDASSDRHTSLLRPGHLTKRDIQHLLVFFLKSVSHARSYVTPLGWQDQRQAAVNSMWTALVRFLHRFVEDHRGPVGPDTNLWVWDLEVELRRLVRGSTAAYSVFTQLPGAGPRSRSRPFISARQLVEFHTGSWIRRECSEEVDAAVSVMLLEAARTIGHAELEGALQRCTAYLQEQLLRGALPTHGRHTLLLQAALFLAMSRTGEDRVLLLRWGQRIYDLYASFIPALPTDIETILVIANTLAETCVTDASNRHRAIEHIVRSVLHEEQHVCLTPLAVATLIQVVYSHSLAASALLPELREHALWRITGEMASFDEVAYAVIRSLVSAEDLRKVRAGCVAFVSLHPHRVRTLDQPFLCVGQRLFPQSPSNVLEDVMESFVQRLEAAVASQEDVKEAVSIPWSRLVYLYEAYAAAPSDSHSVELALRDDAAYRHLRVLNALATFARAHDASAEGRPQRGATALTIGEKRRLLLMPLLEGIGNATLQQTKILREACQHSLRHLVSHVPQGQWEEAVALSSAIHRCNAHAKARASSSYVYVALQYLLKVEEASLVPIEGYHTLLRFLGDGDTTAEELTEKQQRNRRTALRQLVSALLRHPSLTWEVAAAVAVDLHDVETTVGTDRGPGSAHSIFCKGFLQAQHRRSRHVAMLRFAVSVPSALRPDRLPILREAAAVAAPSHIPMVQSLLRRAGDPDALQALESVLGNRCGAAPPRSPRRQPLWGDVMDWRGGQSDHPLLSWTASAKDDESKDEVIQYYVFSRTPSRPAVAATTDEVFWERLPYTVLVSAVTLFGERFDHFKHCNSRDSFLRCAVDLVASLLMQLAGRIRDSRLPESLDGIDPLWSLLAQIAQEILQQEDPIPSGRDLCCVSLATPRPIAGLYRLLSPILEASKRLAVAMTSLEVGGEAQPDQRLLLQLVPRLLYIQMALHVSGAKRLCEATIPFLRGLQSDVSLHTSVERLHTTVVDYEELQASALSHFPKMLPAVAPISGPPLAHIVKSSEDRLRFVAWRDAHLFSNSPLRCVALYVLSANVLGEGLYGGRASNVVWLRDALVSIGSLDMLLTVGCDVLRQKATDAPSGFLPFTSEFVVTVFCEGIERLNRREVGMVVRNRDAELPRACRVARLLNEFVAEAVGCLDRNSGIPPSVAPTLLGLLRVTGNSGSSASLTAVSLMAAVPADQLQDAVMRIAVESLALVEWGAALPKALDAGGHLVGRHAARQLLEVILHILTRPRGATPQGTTKPALQPRLLTLVIKSVQLSTTDANGRKGNICTAMREPIDLLRRHYFLRFTDEAKALVRESFMHEQGAQWRSAYREVVDHRPTHTTRPAQDLANEAAEQERLSRSLQHVSAWPQAWRLCEHYRHEKGVRLTLAQFLALLPLLLTPAYAATLEPTMRWHAVEDWLMALLSDGHTPTTVCLQEVVMFLLQPTGSSPCTVPGADTPIAVLEGVRALHRVLLLLPPITNARHKLKATDNRPDTGLVNGAKTYALSQVTVDLMVRCEVELCRRHASAADGEEDWNEARSELAAFLDWLAQFSRPAPLPVATLDASIQCLCGSMQGKRPPPLLRRPRQPHESTLGTVPSVAQGRHGGPPPPSQDPPTLPRVQAPHGANARSLLRLAAKMHQLHDGLPSFPCLVDLFAAVAAKPPIGAAEEVLSLMSRMAQDTVHISSAGRSLLSLVVAEHQALWDGSLTGATGLTRLLSPPAEGAIPSQPSTRPSAALGAVEERFIRILTRFSPLSAQSQLDHLLDSISGDCDYLSALQVAVDLPPHGADAQLSYRVLCGRALDRMCSEADDVALAESVKTLLSWLERGVAANAQDTRSAGNSECTSVYADDLLLWRFGQLTQDRAAALGATLTERCTKLVKRTVEGRASYMDPSMTHHIIVRCLRS